MGNKRLYKVEKGKKICGVCLGIADYLNIDVTLVRLVWAAATIFTGFVAGIILYLSLIHICIQNSCLSFFFLI